MLYAFAALGIGMLTPFCYTFKAFAIRKFCANYKAWDVGIDALIFEHLAYCIMYIGYLTYAPWRWEEFIYGQIVGLFYLVGKQTPTMAYSEGPGGPVNTIVITQSFY